MVSVVVVIQEFKELKDLIELAGYKMVTTLIKRDKSKPFIDHIKLLDFKELDKLKEFKELLELIWLVEVVELINRQKHKELIKLKEFKELKNSKEMLRSVGLFEKDLLKLLTCNLNGNIRELKNYIFSSYSVQIIDNMSKPNRKQIKYFLFISDNIQKDIAKKIFKPQYLKSKKILYLEDLWNYDITDESRVLKESGYPSLDPIWHREIMLKKRQRNGLDDPKLDELYQQARETVKLEEYIERIRKQKEKPRPDRPKTRDEWKKLIPEFSTKKALAEYLEISTQTITDDLKEFKTTYSKLKKEINNEHTNKISKT